MESWGTLLEFCSISTIIPLYFDRDVKGKIGELR
jgi:hypothetical protein